MRIIGLISGTSVDGIDAALVDICGSGYDLSLQLVDTCRHPYPDSLRQSILKVCSGQAITLEALAELDDVVGQTFAAAAQALGKAHPSIDLIASHGQTVFHRPLPLGNQQQGKPGLAYSLQLGRGSVIAELTGLPIINNFRQGDINVGGEGAPLVSLVDVCLLSHDTQTRCVQNIGGIGNVTYLPARSKPVPLGTGVLGWDTGPGNSLLDIAVSALTNGVQTYDENGNWAAQGTPDLALVEHWLSHPFFIQPPPKSTGRELFGWTYFEQCHRDAQQHQLSPADFLASLTELTARSIVLAYHGLPAPPDQVLVSGGGRRNRYLMERLQYHLTDIPVIATDTVGLSSDYKEAIAFAVLGYWRYHNLPGNLPAVTGARRPALLGEIVLPP